jgi:RNA polymerase sigma factor (sigma-70 family)
MELARNMWQYLLKMDGRENLADAADADLVARARAGDREAFAGLYCRHRRSIYRFAFEMTLSREAAEDIVQEVFVALMRGLARYDGIRPLVAYLYGTARNITRRRLRRERRVMSLGLDEGVMPRASEADFAAHLERRDDLRRLREAIVRLPAKYREVIVMCDLHKMSYQLTAAAIGCPVGTVRSRLHRARAILAERMQQGHAGTARLSRRTAGWAV